MHSQSGSRLPTKRELPMVENREMDEQDFMLSLAGVLAGRAQTTPIISPSSIS